jgi:cytochrome b561
MPIRNTTTRWGYVAQLLHWTIAVLIIVQFVLGYMTRWAPRDINNLPTLSLL